MKPSAARLPAPLVVWPWTKGRPWREQDRRPRLRKLRVSDTLPKPVAEWIRRRVSEPGVHRGGRILRCAAAAWCAETSAAPQACVPRARSAQALTAGVIERRIRRIFARPCLRNPRFATPLVASGAYASRRTRGRAPKAAARTPALSPGVARFSSIAAADAVPGALRLTRRSPSEDARRASSWPAGLSFSAVRSCPLTMSPAESAGEGGCGSRLRGVGRVGDVMGGGA
jgi:hypothetical protein